MSAVAVRERTPLVVGACLLAMAMRPVGWTATFVTLVVGAVGLTALTDTAPATSRSTWCAVTAAGVAAFALVRLRASGPSMRTTAIGIAASLVAAVAEEVFFRRLLYGRLQRFGPFAAVVGAAALFAAVHVPGYGVGALPVDFAAGLVLGWQRWATGTWTAPATTHAFANLVQVL
jgi:membrane protease YdiL (CAAX protease family)